MKNRKGVATSVWVLVLVVIAMLSIGVGAVASGMFQPKPAAITRPEADGEWDTLQAPQEVAGSDISVTSTSISDDGDYTAGSGVMTTDYDLNGTDGSDHNLAFGIEVSSNRLEDVEIDGSLDDLTKSQVVIRNAYIVPDEEGVNLDSEDAVYTAEVPTDQDEFDFDVASLPEGEYVLNVELKSITTSAITSGNDIVEIEFDADTDDDVDSFTADIQDVSAS